MSPQRAVCRGQGLREQNLWEVSLDADKWAQGREAEPRRAEPSAGAVHWKCPKEPGIAGNP